MCIRDRVEPEQDQAVRAVLLVFLVDFRQDGVLEAEAHEPRVLVAGIDQVVQKRVAEQVDALAFVLVGRELLALDGVSEAEGDLCLAGRPGRDS